MELEPELELELPVLLLDGPVTMGVELPAELVPGAEEPEEVPPVGDPVTTPLVEEELPDGELVEEELPEPPDGDPAEPLTGAPAEGVVVPPV